MHAYQLLSVGCSLAEFNSHQLNFCFIDMGTPYLRGCHHYEKPAENGRFERRFSGVPYLRVLKGEMMPTKAHKKQVVEILDKYFSPEIPIPLDPKRLQRFRALCLEEAKRLMGFLAQPLPKKARRHIEERVLWLAALASQSSVTLEQARRLAAGFRCTLTQFKNLP